MAELECSPESQEAEQKLRRKQTHHGVTYASTGPSKRRALVLPWYVPACCVSRHPLSVVSSLPWRAQGGVPALTQTQQQRTCSCANQGARAVVVVVEVAVGVCCAGGAERGGGRGAASSHRCRLRVLCLQNVPGFHLLHDQPPLVHRLFNGTFLSLDGGSQLRVDAW